MSLFRDRGLAEICRRSHLRSMRALQLVAMVLGAGVVACGPSTAERCRQIASDSAAVATAAFLAERTSDSGRAYLDSTTPDPPRPSDMTWYHERCVDGRAR